MTTTRRTLSQSEPAVRQRYRSTVPAPVFYVADPWQDWKRDFAQLRDGRMVTLWHAARPIVLTMCGLLGQTDTDVRDTEDCEHCQQARANEPSAAAPAIPPTREQKAAR